jgi:ABC-type dipeptide/oligopeptide/nickel transport system permease subunit
MSDQRPTGGADVLEPDDADEAARPEDQLLHSGSTQLGAGAVAAASAVEGGVSEYQASLWGDAWRQLRRKPLFLIAAALLVLFVAIAIAPGVFTNQSPEFADLSRSVETPSAEHWFGFDIQGRDYFARVLYGTRVSLIIGFLVVGVDVVLAIILGCIAGFYGRFFDAVIGRGADIWFALPTTLAGIVFLSVLGNRGLFQVSAVLIFLGWPTLMRLMRSSVLAGKEADYVQAARALGASDLRILRVHILPNGIAPVIVYATISVGIIVSAEAALSFLGVGLQLPEISWGLMIADSQGRLLSSPHLLLFPGAFLSVFVLCFIILGDQLRDALDPRLR